MPSKTKRKVSSKPSKKTSSNKLVLIIKRTLFVLIPVFALLAGLGILQASFTRSSVDDFVADAETSRSLFYSFDSRVKTATFENSQVSIPDKLNKTLAQTKTNPVLGESTGGEKWIEVNLTSQTLTAHDGDQIFLETLVSTGLPGRATPTGEFKIWYKIKSTKMSGGEGSSYYYLPNVPYVMFFENEQVLGYKGYSLHGTYWHNDFGHRRSHGCVNLPTPIAEKLYEWTNPSISDGTRVIRASADNPGTRIVIHN